MFKSLVLACLQAYLAMAEQVDESTCLEKGGEWQPESDVPFNDYYNPQCLDAQALCDENDGSKWDGHSCISAKERKSVCLNNGGEWKKNEYGVLDCEKSAEVLCAEQYDGSQWDRYQQVCRSAEESCVRGMSFVWRNGSCVLAKPFADICFEEGNEWAYVEEYYQVCRPAEDLRRDCKNAGGEWEKIYYNGYGGCKPAKVVCSQKNDGSKWDYNTGVCRSAEEEKEACVNEGGSWYKNDYGTFKCNPLDGDAVVTSLAQADAQTKSNYSNAYTGAAFGAVGLAATFFLVSTCNKKEVSERQSSLLDGYQSANHL